MGKHAFDVNSVAGKGVVLSLPNEGVHLYIPVDLKKSNDFYHDKKRGGGLDLKIHTLTHTQLYMEEVVHVGRTAKETRDGKEVGSRDWDSHKRVLFSILFSDVLFLVSCSRY